MIRVMPLVRPGRIFDYAAIANGNFGADLVSAGVLGFALACVGWGLNMGVTMTLAGLSCRNRLLPNTEQELCLSTASGYLGVLPSVH